MTSFGKSTRTGPSHPEVAISKALLMSHILHGGNDIGCTRTGCDEDNTQFVLTIEAAVGTTVAKKKKRKSKNLTKSLRYVCISSPGVGTGVYDNRE